MSYLRSLPGDSVDLVITDPPYESLEKHRKVGTTTRLKQSKSSSNSWFKVFPNQRFAALLVELYRILKPDTHFYLFCDAETMFFVKPLAESIGFRFWKPIIWDKVKMGMGYHYRAQCERILFFEKGRRRLNDLGISDVLSVPRIHGGYPTEKPVSLMEILVKQSTVEGDVVLDPFVGAGAVGVASVQLSRSFLGNDISDVALTITRERLLAAIGDDHAGSQSPRMPRDEKTASATEGPDRPPLEEDVEQPSIVAADVPQADNLQRVMDLVEHVVDGRKITPQLVGGSSRRQVGYYTHAARILGLLDGAQEPTDRARILARMRPDRRQQLEAVANWFTQSAIGRSWMLWADVTVLCELKPETALPFLGAQNVKLGASTHKRRAKTLENWVRVLQSAGREQAP